MKISVMEVGSLPRRSERPLKILLVLVCQSEMVSLFCQKLTILWLYGMKKSSWTELEAPSLLTGFHNAKRCHAGFLGRIIPTSPAWIWTLHAMVPAQQGRWARWGKGGIKLVDAANCLLTALKVCATDGKSQLVLQTGQNSMTN